MSNKKPQSKPTPPATTPRRKRTWLWITIVAVVLVAVAAVLTVLLWPPKISTEVSADLDACVVSTLRKVHYSHHTDTKYPAVAYTTLGVEEDGDTVTLYGVMMYREYTCTTLGKLEVWCAENQSFAITAKKTDNGYEAVDCWWPENGADYYESIEKKFPKKLREAALNPQQYFAVHSAACQADAQRNIAAADKYVVMQTEAKNVSLAYCPNNDGAYIIFGAGYNSAGTYAREGDLMRFSLKEKSVQLAFTVDGDNLVYNAAASVDVPKEWLAIGDTEYIQDGIIFMPETSAPVDPKDISFTAASSTWMSEDELREMFGQYVPQSFDYAASDNHYLPVRPIETRDQLDRFIATYADSWADIKTENFAQYDDAFFEDNYLLMTYYRDGMAASEPKISEYVYVQDGTSLWLSVRLEVTRPAVGDTVVGQWVLFSGVAKEDYKKITSLEAYVEKVVTEETAASDFTLTGKVKEVDGSAMLLECEGDSQFTTVWVELGDAELDPMVGETYVVTYEDMVMPSLPPRITAVTITKP